MKIPAHESILPLTLAMLIGFSLLHADTDNEALGKLTARIGDRFWSPPEKRLVRATIYARGADGGKSDEQIRLRYATDKEAGTLAVPEWLPRGSMVKIHTEQGVLAYIAADEGPRRGGETRGKESGKTEEQKAAPVLDFCAAKQLVARFRDRIIQVHASEVSDTCEHRAFTASSEAAFSRVASLIPENAAVILETVVPTEEASRANAKGATNLRRFAVRANGSVKSLSLQLGDVGNNVAPKSPVPSENPSSTPSPPWFATRPPKGTKGSLQFP